ncbi:MAG: hypothetical protein AAGG55_05735 [Pseudomonadota bacterium]
MKEIIETEELAYAAALLDALGEPLLPEDWIVEIGAWDGIHKSNIAHRVWSDRCKGLFVEADPERFGQLRDNYREKTNAVCLNATVGSEGSEIGTLFSRCGISVARFVSIDIDGNDIHVMRGVSSSLADMICVEFNPSIPSFLQYEQPQDPNVMDGSSFRSVKEALEELGYIVVKVIHCNVIAISSRFGVKVDVHIDESVANLLEVRSDIPWLAFAFDGAIVSGVDQFKDTRRGFMIQTKHLSPIPKFLRKMPSHYNLVERQLLKVLKAWNRRSELPRRMLSIFSKE